MVDYDAFFKDMEDKGQKEKVEEQRKKDWDFNEGKEWTEEQKKVLDEQEDRVAPVKEMFNSGKIKIEQTPEGHDSYSLRYMEGLPSLNHAEDRVKMKRIPEENVFDVEIAKSKLEAKDMKELTIQAEMLVVETDEDAQKGVSIGMQARKMSNAIERTRKTIVRPHLDFQKAVKAYADEFQKCLNNMEQSILKKVEVFQEKKDAELKKTHDAQMAKEAAEAETIRKAEEVARKKAKKEGKPLPVQQEISDITPPKQEVFVPPPQKIAVTDGTSTTVVKWVFEIENAKAIPFEYMQVNERAIKEAIAGGMRSIPGVKIYEKKTTQYRAK